MNDNRVTFFCTFVLTCEFSLNFSIPPAHSPDNTFLGFIAGSVKEKKLFKKNQALIYGKLALYLDFVSNHLKNFNLCYNYQRFF